MAESVLEVVGKLQSRLSGSSEPKKLLKSLKRLSELPITVDILLETGVGKTVNGLRKHELVGDFAKNLVARWKKLVPVPQEAERNNLEVEERSYDRSSSRKRRQEPSPREDEDVEEDYSEAYQPSCSQSYEPEYGAKRPKRYPEPERAHQPVNCGIPEGRTWDRESPVLSSDQEGSDYGHAASPEPSESPQELYVDLCRVEEPEKEQKALPRKANKGQGFLDRQEGGHSRNLSDSQDKASSSRSKEHKSSHKEKQRPDAKAGEERLPERLHKGFSREPPWEAPLAGGSKERLKALESAKREKKRDGSNSKKEKPPVDLEDSLGNHTKKHKHQDMERAKQEKAKLGPDVSHGDREQRKPEAKSSGKNKEKKASGSLKTPEGHKKAVGFLPAGSGEGDGEDEFEQPTMSFESYMGYDQPQKKKKKLAKPPPPAPEKDRGHGKQNGSKPSAKSSNSSRKAHKQANEKKQSGASKPKKIPIDVVPTLPDIPLPPIQANYRPLPSLESIPLSQPKRKALSSPTEEDEAGFTGRRLNSKMQVYSGSKTAYLPKMMSLHEQCIRVLSNNIDSIYEVGGVPFSVLEPVLERCTPEQLYRIEECNHVLIEDTDQLWHNHCLRDFKKEKPEEFESWREMYLRLHDAREQRLLMLTQNIRSAHANKPRGRVAKMAFVNSAAKPPRDVRRRQEKFGTGGAAVPEKIKIKPVLFTPAKSSSIHTEEEQSYDGPSTSSGHSGPSLGSSSSLSYDPRKPPVKKIAPMMAKTIKAFKNRFSRR
ncbi:elongin-A [Hemicordylus capensis]|uniref:elongin-A n=1 Tax=Hemicordylus capensis TaxID=884348 RepID=UPI00230297BD|nr:elongin-A [Hemicordylus capensis]